MTTKTKICSKCGVGKPLDEFHKQKGGKDGKRGDCKDCFNETSRKYHREHREEINKKGREYYRKVDSHRRGHLSMYENKFCAQYLGVVIGERLCRHLFKDVEVMPYGNTGYDIICNKGKLIDVKTSSTLLQKGKYSHWGFHIKHNAVADFFILVAFDNRTNLNPLYLWMIPGKEVNNQSGIQISPSTIHKWDKWKRDINDAQLCCTEMKK